VGGGAGVRITERTPTAENRDEGVSFEVRGAVERETALYAGQGVCSTNSDPVLEPTCNEASHHNELPTHTFVAGDVRVGVSTDKPRDRWTIGLLLFSTWIDDRPRFDPARPAVVVWPAIERAVYMRLGASFLVGTGSPFVETLRRPAFVYTGFRTENDRGFSLTGVFGWFRAGLGLDGSDRGASGTSNAATTSMTTMLASDPTFAFHAQGVMPLGKSLSFIPAGGFGGLLNTYRGLGPDYSMSIGLRLRL
jgi:hypothetical protein